MSGARALAGELLWNEARLVAGYAMALVASVVCARALGPTEYGSYLAVAGWFSALAPVLSMGFGERMLQRFPGLSPEALGGEFRWAFRRFLAVQAVASSVLLAVWGLLLEWHPQLPPRGRMLAASVWAVGLAAQGFLGTAHIAVGRTRCVFDVAWIGYLLHALVLLAVFLCPSGALYLWGLALAAWACAAILHARFPRGAAPSDRGGFWNGSVPYLWARQVVDAGLGRSIQIVAMTLLLTDAGRLAREITVFGIAAQWLTFVNIALHAGFQDVGLRAYVDARRSGGEAGLRILWRSCLLYAVGVTAPWIGLAALAGQPFLSGLYGSAYAGAADLLLLWLGFGAAGRILGGGDNVTLLLATGRARAAFLARLVAGAANVGLCLLWIPSLGAQGAVLAAGVSGVGGALAERALLLGVLRGAYPVRGIAGILAACLGGTLLARGLAQGHAVAAVAVYAAAAPLFLWAWKPLDRADLDLLRGASPRLAGWIAPFARGMRGEGA
ncbi:MAG: hypothetical protein HY608_07415 [Planctomycetes bacterium]|nr:hypothetical protein [Planctomycetota bacterium]